MGYIDISVEVDTDDFIYEIPDSELIEEVSRRKLTIDFRNTETSARDLIDQLKRMGCPDNILKPLNEWLCVPCPTPEKLEKWKEWATR